MENRIINGDCLEKLKEMPSESIDLIITSPPYNKGHWSRNRNVNNGFKTKKEILNFS